MIDLRVLDALCLNSSGVFYAFDPMRLMTQSMIV